jgi:hypothetical protein
MAHYPCRNREEVAPILPIDVLGFHQPKEGFVYKCCGLEGIFGPLSSKTAFSYVVQVRHQELKQFAFYLPVAGPPLP